MGLVKRTTNVTTVRAPPRSFDELLGDLAAAAPAHRRAAARELGAHAAAAGPLCARLPHEPELSVREGIVTALLRLGTAEVVAGLVAHLESEDVWLRNAAIEALSQMPDVSRTALTERLAHPEADVRILAVTALARRPDDATAARLVRLLAEDPDVNVCAAALEAVAERGDRDALAALASLPRRFEGDDFIAFACVHAAERIASRLP